MYVVGVCFRDLNVSSVYTTVELKVTDFDVYPELQIGIMRDAGWL